jgi:hypothetical protein
MKKETPLYNRKVLLTLLTQQKCLKKMSPPPYLERLLVKKYEVPLGHNLEIGLRNICVKIPLLQAIKDIAIYDKIVRDIFIKIIGRKRKEPFVI